MVSFCCIALGELSYGSEMAKDQFRGRMMSLITMSFAYASYGAAELSQRISVQTLRDYQSFFLSSTVSIGIVLACLITAYAYHGKKRRLYRIIV